jgi:cobalt-zinc-cadmium efflux system membrane fusion protein
MKAFLYVVCLSAVLCVGGCGTSGGGQSQSAAPAAASPNDEIVLPGASGIETVTAQKTTIPDYLDLPAHIEADPTRVVHVFPPAGGRIVEMKVRPWDWVEKGQTLATIESSDLSRAVADYHKALADHELKEQQLARSADLFAHDAIAMKEYQQAKANEQTSQAELDATKEQVRVLGMDPDHATAELVVAAPRAGVILDVGASPGEFSNALASSQPLCTIADISTIWAVGDIYEVDLAAAKAGESAEVTLNAYPTQKWSGHVDVVSDAVDPNTRTLRVRVVLANPGTRLKPSMFGSIRLSRSSREGILVPAAAVIHEGTTAYVFMAEGQGRYRRRDVTLGEANDGNVEIKSGVKSGDSIVAQGALLLRAGSAS